MSEKEIIDGANIGKVPEVSSNGDVSGISETIRGQAEGVEAKSDGGSDKPELVYFGRKMIPKEKAEELRRFVDQCEGRINEYEVSGWIFFDENGRVGLRQKGSMDLSGCTKLKSLPEGLRVDVNLILVGCTNLESLPKGLRVGMCLYLIGCTGLKSLSEGLNVGWNLHLTDCKNLESLPEGLSVGLSLSLSGCISLKSLPEEFKVGQHLNLCGCTGLYSLKTYNLLKRLLIENKIKNIEGFLFDDWDYLFGDDAKLSDFIKRYWLLKENISEQVVVSAIDLVNLAIGIYDEYRKGFVDEFNKMKEESKKGNVDEKIISRGKEIKALIIDKRKELSGRLKAIFSQDLIDAIIEREKKGDVVRFFN